MRRLIPLFRVAALGFVFSLAASAQEHGGEGGAPDFTWWKVANFLILAGAVGYFLYKKAGGFFAGRTAQIQHGLTEAARLKADAEERYAATERKLANLGAEIDGLRHQMREESTAAAARARQETAREMERIQSQAELEIAAAGKAARLELRAFSAELAVGLAEEKLRQRMTPEADGALVSNTVRELGSRFAGRPGRTL